MIYVRQSFTQLYPFQQLSLELNIDMETGSTFS